MRKIARLSLITLSLAFMLGCNTTQITPQTQLDDSKANRLFVEASLYQHTGEFDKQYDLLQTIIKNHPGSNASVVSSLEISELKGKVFNGGIKKDSDTYPQSTYQDLLRSLIKVFKNKDAQYLMHHLSPLAHSPDAEVDPDIIETMQKLLDSNDPKIIGIIDNLHQLLDNNATLEYVKGGGKGTALLYELNWQDIRGLKLIKTDNNYYWYFK